MPTATTAACKRLFNRTHKQYTDKNNTTNARIETHQLHLTIYMALKMTSLRLSKCQSLSTTTEFFLELQCRLVIQTKKRKNKPKAILEEEQQITFRSQLRKHLKQIIYSLVPFFFLDSQFNVFMIMARYLY